MNTLSILVAENSNLKFKDLETKAAVSMNTQGLEELIFTHIHFDMRVKLEGDTERERRKANSVYNHSEDLPTETVRG